MLFKDFIEVYTEDMKPRLKYNTWLTKEHIIKTKLLPYFGNKKMNEIRAADIVRWQNEMMSFRDEEGAGYSKVYLKTLQSQLSAIFNHGIRLYELKENPVRKAGSMGGERRKEMLVWTKDEYQKFSEAVIDKPQSYYAFEILYWAGLRVGELLALTPADIDFERKTITINKSYQRLQGEVIPRQKRVTGQYLFRTSYVRNCRNTSQCSMDLKRMTECSRLQRVICTMKWKEEQRLRE